jgi:hypothetical protein
VAATNRLFTPHPLLLQTAYSELKRLAGEQRLLLVGTPGSVSEREVKGSRFLYRQYYDALGAKSADYIGPAADADALARADLIREQISLAAEIASTTRILFGQGYARADDRVCAILAALANQGLFRAGALVIGSYAYAACLNDAGARAATFATEDIDVARDRALSLELAEGATFESILAESKVPLFAIPTLDRKQPSTSYTTRGRERLRVDLVVPTQERMPKVLPVRELRTHAMGLPHLRYLVAETVDGLVMGRHSVVPVKIPRSERLALHKMLVSQLRAATSDKRTKDIEQAAVLVAILSEQAPTALAEAFADVPRSALEKTRRGAAQVMARLRAADHERAAALLENVVL